MAANIPDLGAVSHLGSQFHHNVFASAQKSLNTKSKKFAEAHVAQVKQTASNRDAYARSAASAVKQGQAAYAKNQKTQQTAAKKAAATHAAGVKSGRVAPAQGAAPRTFAMGSTPQQKAQAKATAQSARTATQQRNNAHGQAINMQNQMNRTQQSQVNTAHTAALNFQSAQFKTMQQQRNYAHGQAIQQQKQLNKPTQGGPVNTSASKAPSLSPAFSNPTATHTPIKAQSIAPTTFSSQLTPQKPQAAPTGTPTATFSSGSSNGAAKPATAPRKPPVSSQFSSGPATGGGSFPLHSHPAGSSTAPLPNLTAAQSKPNTFTTGSRNARPNGIAARGSQLEAWAMGRQAEIRKQRGTDNPQLRLGD